ncbi:MAG TPA: hypothetical protein VGP26_26700 [Actinophytocola sp.]|jgi:hypothetical protein|nr:hypothetical protein [Actinophytocola sp.]
MGDGYTADVEQIRRHAENLESLKARFDAVKSASAAIAQDGQAYGLLCGWMPAVLEGRHARQDELVAYVEENLGLAAKSLHDSADHYAELDARVADAMGDISDRMP